METSRPWILLALLTLATSMLGASTPTDGFRVVAGPAAAGENSTTLTVRVEQPEGGIVGLQKMKNTIAAYRDDAGSDLHHGTHAWERLGEVRVGSDGRYLEFDIKGRRAPAAGSTRLHAEGSATIDCASGRKTSNSESVTIAAGRQFEVGAIPVTLERTRPDTDAAFQIVHLHFGGVTTSNDPIIEMRFIDDAGQPLEAQIIAQQYMKSEYIVQVRMPAAVQTMKVSLDHWLDFRRVVVPYSVTAKL